MSCTDEYGDKSMYKKIDTEKIKLGKINEYLIIRNKLSLEEKIKYLSSIKKLQSHDNDHFFIPPRIINHKTT